MTPAAAPSSSTIPSPACWPRSSSCRHRRPKRLDGRGGAARDAADPRGEQMGMRSGKALKPTKSSAKRVAKKAASKKAAPKKATAKSAAKTPVAKKSARKAAANRATPTRPAKAKIVTRTVSVDRNADLRALAQRIIDLTV